MGGGGRQWQCSMAGCGDVLGWVRDGLGGGVGVYDTFRRSWATVRVGWRVAGPGHGPRLTELMAKPPRATTAHDGAAQPERQQRAARAQREQCGPQSGRPQACGNTGRGTRGEPAVQSRAGLGAARAGLDEGRRAPSLPLIACSYAAAEVRGCSRNGGRVCTPDWNSPLRTQLTLTRILFALSLPFSLFFFLRPMPARCERCRPR